MLKSVNLLGKILKNFDEIIRKFLIMLNKILVAYSGTGNSEEILKYLLLLPSLGNASITLLNAVSSKTPSDDLEAKLEEGGKVLAKTITELKLDPSQITTVLRQGEPKDTVLKVAEEINADLIVMGSRGLGRLEAILRNSVSQYVFQLANRPMLLVKDDIYVKRIKKVMVAMDKSNASQDALNTALFLLRDYPDGELVLARINPDLDKNITLSPEEIEDNPILAPAAKKAKQMGVKCSCLVQGGRPAKEICNLVEELNIDLLVLGSPDRRPSIAKTLPDLDRLLGKSLSDYVRVNATCPVLLTRTEGA
jgi:nucleotide-binding universal stress UspA family protein